MPVESKLTVLTDETYEGFIQQPRAILVAMENWCGPCRLYRPILRDAADHFPGVRFGEASQEAGSKIEHYLDAVLCLKSIPTTFLYKEGKLGDRVVGFLPSRRLLDVISNFFGLETLVPPTVEFREV